MAERLRDKTVKGTIWSTLQKFGSMALMFGTNIVLARTLMPADFGAIAMLAIFLAIADTLMDGGLPSSIIQKKEVSPKDLSTVFTFNLSLSFVLYLIFFICAPWISKFYDLLILTPILRVESLVFVINAFAMVQSAMLRKKMAFGKIAKANISASVGGSVISIGLALFGWGIWALVWQQIIFALIRCLLFWIQNPWRPHLLIDKASFRSLFSFGVFVSLSNLTMSIGNKIQDVIIGKAFSATSLGYYSQASKLELLSSTTISTVIEQVAYPALATKQNDFSSLVYVLRKFIKMIAFISFPLMILLALCGSQIITLCYGTRWAESIPMFQILCLAGIAICLQGINYNAIAALGKSKSLFSWSLVKTIVGLGFLLFGCMWGIYGVMWGLVARSWLCLVVNAWQVQIFTQYTLWKQFKDLLSPAAAVTIAAVAAVGIGYVCKFEFYLEGLTKGVIFCIVYLGFAYLRKDEAMRDSIDILKSLVNKNKE